MHVMCENNERYDCKNARWIKKTTQCMRILSQMMHEKYDRSRKQKNFNFLVSICRMESSINRILFLEIFDRLSINQTSIESSRDFWP